MSEAGKFVRVIAGLTVVIWPAVCQAQNLELYPSEIANLGGSVKCLVNTIGWIVNTTGPCQKANIPRMLAVGSVFTESGKDHRINIIQAKRVATDLPELKLKAGDWVCVAGESRDDIDSDSNKSRRAWLFIPDCAPVGL